MWTRASMELETEIISMRVNEMDRVLLYQRSRPTALSSCPACSRGEGPLPCCAQLITIVY